MAAAAIQALQRNGNTQIGQNFYNFISFFQIHSQPAISFEHIEKMFPYIEKG